MKTLHKLKSLRAFKKHGLPTLPYFVLPEKKFRKEIASFLKKHKVNRFMLRTDGNGLMTPSYNNVEPNDKTFQLISDLFKSGFAVFIMTPGNTYRNLHSLNISAERGKITVEAVGPGFIATDLNRFGFLHESLRARLSDRIIFNKEMIIENKEYGRDRLIKITELGEEELKRNKSYLLEYKNYKPIDGSEVSYLSQVIPKLMKTCLDLNAARCSFVASMSFINLKGESHQPIFWDLYCL